jgi:hypothetical protein
MESATKLKTTAAEIIKAKIQSQPQVKQIDITSNPIAKIVLDPKLEPEERVSQLAGALSPETEAEQAAQRKALEETREFIASKRAAAARKQIELASTTIFAKVKQVIGGMQQGVVNFDNTMQPMTDDLQVIFDLRTSGKMNQTVARISEDRVKEADWEKRHHDIDVKTAEINSDVKHINSSIMVLQEDKNIFGSVKKSALMQIAAKQEQLKSFETEMEEQKKLYDALMQEQTAYDADHAEDKETKDKLRRMLDISGEEYIKKMEKVITDALSFIDTSKKDVGELREELGDLDEQAANQIRINGQLKLVTAILDKGIDKAQDINVGKVKSLAVVPADEDMLSQVTRTQKKNDIERFVAALKGTSTSVKGTVSALTDDAISANNFSQIVADQRINIQELHSEGIASVTSNLSQTINAFNAAALNEGAENARQAMFDMNTVTDKIRNQSVISSAMTLENTERRVVERINSLSSVTDALDTANKLSSQGMSSLAQRLAELNKANEDAMAKLQTNIGIAANADSAPVVIVEAKKTDEKMDLMSL